MAQGYSFQGNKENMVKAYGRGLNVSPKQGYEICKYLKGRSLVQSKGLLKQAIDMKKPIPFTRFTNGLGHKPGIAAGRFHPKACALILKLLNSAEANAKNKGLNTSDLKIIHLSAQTAAKSWHYGRKKRSIFKNLNIEVVLSEVKGLGSSKKDKSKDTSKDANKGANKDVKNKSTHSESKKVEENKD